MDNNEKINELKELLAEGILTQEEFDNEMAKLNGDTEWRHPKRGVY